MGKTRPALKVIPHVDPQNNIGVVDRVRLAMLANRMDALTVDEQAQYKRWQQIDDWFRSKRYTNENGEEAIVAGRRNIRNLAMVKFIITWDTAERDIVNAIKLFTPADDDKEYQRSVYVEDVEQKAAEAAAAGKYGEYASLMKLAGEWRKFDKEPVIESQDKFQTFQFIIEYNPEAIGLKRIPEGERAKVLERWRKRKSASDKMLDGAEEAQYDIE